MNEENNPKVEVATSETPASNFDIHPSLQQAMAPENSSADEAPAQESEVNEGITHYDEEDAKAKVQAESDASNAKNFRQLREQAEKLQKERDEALSFAQKLYEEKKKSAAAQPQEKPSTPDYDLKDDDLIEKRHLSAYDRKIEEMQKQLERYQQQAYANTAETRIRNEMPDVDSVVSVENVTRLKEKYPHLAATIDATQDIYTKAKSAYTLIKELGIHVEDNYSQDRQMAQKNASKPKPLSSVSPQHGDSPLSRANAFASGLTPELKKQLLKEMQSARQH